MATKQYKYLTKGLTKPQKVKVLRRTRELLERPGGWIQGAFYNSKTLRDGGRDPIPAMCLAGAAQYAARELGYVPHSLMGDQISATEVADHVSLRDLVQKNGFDSVPEFNDRSRTRKKDILALIDERIAQLEEKA